MALAKGADPGSDLVAAIRMTAQGALDWMSCLERLHDAFNADSTLMYAPPHGGSSFIALMMHKVDLSRIGAKAQRYATKTPFLDEAIARGLAPGAFFDRDVVPTDFNESEHNRDVFKAIDWTDGLQFALRLPTSSDGGLIIKLWRFHPTPCFSAADRSLAERLFPHLLRATAGQFTSPPARAGAIAPVALDALSTPLIILSVHGKETYSNAAAQNLIKKGDLLSVRNGKVEPIDARVARLFRQAIDQAATLDGQSIEVVLPRGDDRAPVLCIVISVANPTRHGLSAEAAAIAYFIDVECHEGHAVQARRAQVLFGLTDAECEVLRLLLDDRSVDEIATERKSAVATVRTQVKAILQKTRKHRQSDLLQLRRLAI
jgi:DNA-binding CsgD family transcriptional regulator